MCEYLTLDGAGMFDVGEHGLQQFVDEVFSCRLAHQCTHAFKQEVLHTQTNTTR